MSITNTKTEIRKYSGHKVFFFPQEKQCTQECLKTKAIYFGINSKLALFHYRRTYFITN